MWIIKTLAVLSLAIMLYHYIGYPLMLWLWCRVRKLRSQIFDFPVHGWPTVSLIVAAYNEQNIIVEKLDNSIELDYPESLLDIIVVTDGSTDSTAQLVRDYIAQHTDQSIKLLHDPERAGKSAAINRAARQADGEILVFSDANAIYYRDSIRKLCLQFSNPEIGAVSGQKTVHKEGVGESESLYWKYESAIKRRESLISSTTGVVGEMFAIRRSQFCEIPANIINDDAFLGMCVVRHGARTVYEQSAICVEYPSASMNDELTRRKRINAGRFQLLFNKQLWPSGDWRYILCFWSHKFLRLLLGPLMVLLLLTSMIVVLTGHGGWFFGLVLGSQLVGYTLAVMHRWPRQPIRFRKLTKLCHFVVASNLSTIPSLVNYLKGEQTVIWERANRLQ